MKPPMSGLAQDVKIRMGDFMRRCKEAGFAATHQRTVIYRVLVESRDHPSPELVYERVSHEIPEISRATVYKNIHTFIDAGMLREVSELHQTNRLDANLERHHHLICTRCRKVVDFEDDQLDGIQASTPEPDGFQVTEYRVEARGLCPACRS
jgi:Fur family peroxide stress response transcriptional regulator